MPFQWRYWRTASTRALAPEGPVLVADAAGEPDRILDRRGLEDEAAVLVAHEVHAVGGDRIDPVGILGLVEEAEHERGGVEAEVAADQSLLGESARVGEPERIRTWGVFERSGGDDHGARLDRVVLAVEVGVLDAGRLEAAVAVLEEDPLDVGVRRGGRASRPRSRRGCRCSSCLARIGRAALQAGAALHAVGSV